MPAVPPKMHPDIPDTYRQPLPPATGHQGQLQLLPSSEDLLRALFPHSLWKHPGFRVPTCDKQQTFTADLFLDPPSPSFSQSCPQTFPHHGAPIQAGSPCLSESGKSLKIIPQIYLYLPL